MSNFLQDAYVENTGGLSNKDNWQGQAEKDAQDSSMNTRLWLIDIVMGFDQQVLRT